MAVAGCARRRHPACPAARCRRRSGRRRAAAHRPRRGGTLVPKAARSWRGAPRQWVSNTAWYCASLWRMASSSESVGRSGSAAGGSAPNFIRQASSRSRALVAREIAPAEHAVARRRRSRRVAAPDADDGHAAMDRAEHHLLARERRSSCRRATAPRRRNPRAARARRLCSMRAMRSTSRSGSMAKPSAG